MSTRSSINQPPLDNRPWDSSSEEHTAGQRKLGFLAPSPPRPAPCPIPCPAGGTARQERDSRVPPSAELPALPHNPPRALSQKPPVPNAVDPRGTCFNCVLRKVLRNK